MADKPIKILTINCSPYPTGQTSQLLQIFIDAAKDLDLQTQEVNLCEEEIPYHTGELGKKLDKLSKIQKMYAESDGFVIATPTYWFNVPAVLKNFIDHLTPLEEENFMTEGKVAGIICYAPEGGELGVLGNLSVALNHMGIVIPPYGLIFYRGVEKDNWAKEDIKLLAKSIKQQVTAQRKLEFSW